MLNAEELEKLVSELASRPRHEKVRVLVHRLLVDGLGADSQDIHFEKPVPEVRGRIDALLGRTVFEFKSDLRKERGDAEQGLTRYLTDREGQTREKYVGIATDGAEFIAFFLRDDHVEKVNVHYTNPQTPRELLIWLQSVVATGDDLPPDPHTITREFGRESLAARRALDTLSTLWEQLRKTPEAGLKRALWERLLGLAYGDEVGDDGLFLQHTYLVIVAKAVAWRAMIDAPPADATALLHGSEFSDLGIIGQNEPDFFDWMLTAEKGADLVMRTERQVARFRLQDIRVDILKALYESLIDPETRHDLGEYYTPDWLAARMVAATVDKPLEQRVMDPACGSGTFLFHAVRAVLGAAKASGLSEAEATRCAAANIAGIDVHPVAVIIARATYLLALMPALRAEHPGNVTVPVYLGDALQWNLARIGERGKQPDLFAGDNALEIFVPSIKLAEQPPRQLDAAILRFPAAVASDAELFDRVLNTMIEFGAGSKSGAAFAAWLAQGTYARSEDRDILKHTYKVMRQLQNEGRNHIWGYVARNLARPVWLSSEAQKADVVIGNPPWVSYRYMSPEFKKRFREECRAARLWVGGKVATQQDLSGYFYMRAALLYMRRTGRVALIMPYAALSRQAYAKFRRGEVAQLGHVTFRLCFTSVWAFGPEVAPLFPVPSCVLFASRHGGAVPAPLPDELAAFAGALPRRDADRLEADANLTETLAPWPAEATDEGGSPYRKRFRNGATLWPRRFVIVEPEATTGMIPPNPAFPLVRGRAGNQDKAPWKNVAPPRGPVDRAFLRPVLLGESIAPFRLLTPLQAVIPWDAGTHQLMHAEEATKRGYSRLAQWLERTETLWEKHKTSDISFLDQCDYYGKLSCQFPIAQLRVVYTKSGANLAASLIQDLEAVIDHKLYWMAAESVDEAHYLCGILNSETVRAGVEGYQAQGQWGARDFDKYVFNLPIPRFDSTNTLHRRLSEAAQAAEDVAELVPVKEGDYFTSTRKRIRAALSEHGIAATLESLVTELLV